MISIEIPDIIIQFDRIGRMSLSIFEDDVDPVDEFITEHIEIMGSVHNLSYVDDEILPRLDTGKNYKYPDMPVIPATQAVQPVQKPRSILKCLKQYRPSWLWYHREVRFVDFPNRTTCSVIAGQSSVTTVTGRTGRMADKNGTAETTDGKNGTTATVPKGILTNPLPIAASGTSGDRDPMVAEAQSAANNNMPNANSNAKISNGPGMTEKTLQGVEMASSEARTTLMTPGAPDVKASSAAKRSSRIRSRSLSASSTDSYSSGKSASETHSPSMSRVFLRLLDSLAFWILVLGELKSRPTPTDFLSKGKERIQEVRTAAAFD
ncbi:hypothetical protein Fcan01_12311 [Folsomia candida]|uniref:Uncharacterized protein n=1 Tax=Folsomia candida TaxID=158441 RepID=A0A226E8C8_FOLCA|nr:hypothetical protein Fcan01_12311 [Folsomia candida]